MNQLLIDAIAAKLTSKRQTISVAESVTAGALQRQLSGAEDARKFFQGGVTTYNLGQKVKLLSVEPIHAEECNCISQQVAEQMARGAGDLFSSDWAIGVTGYAAPVPECDINEPFAFYAISYRGKIVTHAKVSAGQLKGFKAVELYVETIFKKLRSLIGKTAVLKRAR